MSLFGSASDPGQLLESGGTWTLVAVTTAWLEVHFLFIQLENKKNTGQLNMEADRGRPQKRKEIFKDHDAEGVMSGVRAGMMVGRGEQRLRMSRRPASLL